jgi:hypothetical protein
LTAPLWALVVGLYAGALGHRWDAYLALAAVSLWGYRTTMRRPWAKVNPLPDDDD